MRREYFPYVKICNLLSLLNVAGEIIYIINLCHTATTYRTIRTYSTYEIFVIRDTCAIYVILMYYMFFSLSISVEAFGIRVFA